MKTVFFLLMVLGSALLHAKIVPADGLWRTIDDPEFGSGLMLTTQNGITLVSVFTYDAEGQNVWYIASGQVDDAGLYEATILQTHQGEYLLNQIPQSAQVITSDSTINIQFSGSQVATLSINNSEPKTIRADHFGFNTDSGLPDLSGKWVLGNATSGDSYILNLTRLPPVVFGGVSLPYRDIAYSSSHVSTENWQLQCIVIISNEFNNSQCDLVKSSGLDNLTMTAFDIGNQRLTFFIEDDENPETYQAFRLNKDRRLLPSDGHWRTYDDPAIGSGVVMRTQGDYTVVLLYSYDTDGKAMWQIASGQFDINGLLVAELYRTEGGSAINSETVVNAIIQENVQTLEIKLQGTELGTLKIDGSVAKYIQKYNYGTVLHDTELFKINEKRYVFPDQVANWLISDESLLVSSVLNIERENPNCCASPPDPLYFDSVGYTSRTLNNTGLNPNFSLHFNCVKTIVPYSNYIFPKFSFCYGQNYNDDENRLMRIYFEDIGVNEFRYYVGPLGRAGYFGGVDEINRNSEYYQLFRLSAD